MLVAGYKRSPKKPYIYKTEGTAVLFVQSLEAFYFLC